MAHSKGKMASNRQDSILQVISLFMEYNSMVYYFFWCCESYFFSDIEHSLCEKYANMKFFLVLIFPYSMRIRENADQKQLPIRIFFT